MPKNAVGTAMAWLALLGLYLLMVGQVSLGELVLGAILATFITWLSAWLKSIHLVRLRISRRMIAPIRYLPEAVCWETALVFWALGRKLLGKRVFGTTVKVPFKHGGHDPTSAGWRVTAVFGVSVSPNSYVSNVDTKKGEIHIRQLVGRTISRGDRGFLGQPR
jgi:hypothetical protein